MPRYLIERRFEPGSPTRSGADGVPSYLSIVRHNADFGVTWLHSYVSTATLASYCIYDGPDPESIRAAASRSGLPIERIVRVQTLDPYGHHRTCPPAPATAGRTTPRGILAPDEEERS